MHVITSFMAKKLSGYCPFHEILFPFFGNNTLRQLIVNVFLYDNIIWNSSEIPENQTYIINTKLSSIKFENKDIINNIIKIRSLAKC